MSVIIDGDKMILKHLFGKVQYFEVPDIQNVEVKRAFTDIPFLEKSVFIWLKNKKKYAIKNIRSKDVVRLLKRI